jgi:prepilin-type N-terminal cleavage/methylation domain-containing protein
MKNNMKTHKCGFTLIEILGVLAIIGILASIVVVNIPGVLAAARVTAAQTDIRLWSTMIAKAANDLGGTLPITEGGTAVPDCDNATLAGSDATAFYNHARLEQVLMAMPNAMMDSYCRPKLGNQIHTRADGGTAGDITFDIETMKWKNSGAAAAVAVGYSYANVTRLECRTVNKTSTPGVDGSNFFITGDPNVPLKNGRVAYLIIKDTPGKQAYDLAKAVNGKSMMTDTSGEGIVSQTLGKVTYNVPESSTGVVDVYVYMGTF